jgi:hypothetical protein
MSAWQLGPCFVIYGYHIYVVHILYIACADSARNLLITEVIISVVACGRSAMYINSTTFLTRYLPVYLLAFSCLGEKLLCVVCHKFLHYTGLQFELIFIRIMEYGSYLFSEFFS